MCAQATSRALMAARGATYDAWKEGLATEVTQKESENCAIGDVSLFVMPKVGTFRLCARITESTVSCKQRPKLMAIKKSFGPSRFTFCCRFPVDPSGVSASWPSETKA